MLKLLQFLQCGISYNIFSTNTKVIIISTPNGLNSFIECGQRLEENRSSYKTFSANWRDVPNSNDDWAQETLANVGAERFQQEYECDFLGSSNTLISTTKLKIWFGKNSQKNTAIIIY